MFPEVGLGRANIVSFPPRVHLRIKVNTIETVRVAPFEAFLYCGLSSGTTAPDVIAQLVSWWLRPKADPRAGHCDPMPEAPTNPNPTV